MIVYANSFSLRPDNGAQDIINKIAAWVGSRRGCYIDPNQLSNGIREFRMNDGATLSSTVNLDEEKNQSFPYLFCARLQHQDSNVSGRRWITEIGLRQSSNNDYIHCSVLSKTEEISALVSTPIEVTCPSIVPILIESCNPVGYTPSKNVIQLTEQDALMFPYEVERIDRDYPIVLVSYKLDGSESANVEKLRRNLVGLAQVIEIPQNANTFLIEDRVGRRYSSFGGAVNIIFPYQNTDTGVFYKTKLIQSKYMDDLKLNGMKVESKILSLVTHHTNVPNSWKHISMDSVRHEILRTRLYKSAKEAHDTEDLSAYEALLNEAAEGLQEKDTVIENLRKELDLAEGNLGKAQAEIDGLKHALTGISDQDELVSYEIIDSIDQVRKLIQVALGGQISLENALKLTSVLFPDRIVALDSALSSAKESDKGGFLHGDRALDMLIKLSTDYWLSLKHGESDIQAGNIFGKNGFSPKESENLSASGRKRRLFKYKGKEIFMEKHIKYGIKDSIAETLRIHFEWINEQEKIIIGHCGKHLNF